MTPDRMGISPHVDVEVPPMASNSRGGEGTTNAVVRGLEPCSRRLPPSLAAPSVASELSVPPIGRRPGEACCSITPQVGAWAGGEGSMHGHRPG